MLYNVSVKIDNWCFITICVFDQYFEHAYFKLQISCKGSFTIINLAIIGVDGLGTVY